MRKFIFEASSSRKRSLGLPLDTPHTSTLRELARGLRWSGLITVLSHAGQLIVLLLLTHWLPPEAFGLLAWCMALLGFALLFVQNGLPDALLFLQEQKPASLSGLFWLNLGLGTLTGVLLWALRLPWATFGQDTRIAALLAGMAWLPAVVAAGTIYKGVHLQRLAYRHIAAAEIIGATAAAATALYMAWNGYGYQALYGQVAVRYAVENLYYALSGWGHFRPSLQWARSDIAPHLRFAKARLGERLTMFLHAQWDTLLIGKLLGTEWLGVYDVFKRLIGRPLSVLGEWIDRFAFPLMAHTARDQLQLAALYLRLLQWTAMLLAPIAAFGAAFAAPLLTALFGQAWAAHADVFRLLLLAMCVASLLHPADGLLSATGRILRLGYANMLWAAAAVALMWPVSAWGLPGMMAAMLAVHLMAQWGIFRWLLQRELGISSGQYFAAPLTQAGIALACLLPAWAAYEGALHWLPSTAVWVAGLVYGLVWATWQWRKRRSN